ncbi:MAG: hypothetical protein KGN16_03475 [Burkholderiales bacterium]|nr:hypothetical protein [Burkholderiales bacterium]
MRPPALRLVAAAAARPGRPLRDPRRSGQTPTCEAATAGTHAPTLRS